MSIQVILAPNHDVRAFLEPLPALLNGVQDDFTFSVQEAAWAPDSTADVDRAFHEIQTCKAAAGLGQDDLLIRFIGVTLESRARGLTNLFAAVSGSRDTPPRVAAVSTAFIRRHILPADPSYLTQRHAFYHLVVCCLAGAFLDLSGHEDCGCLLDFNNYTPDIKKKIEAGYSFCTSCESAVRKRNHGSAVLRICMVLKDRAASLRFTAQKPAARPRVFLCYTGPDRNQVDQLFGRLTGNGFDVWMDFHSLLAGQDWELEIRRAVNAADYFVVCLSAFPGSHIRK